VLAFLARDSSPNSKKCIVIRASATKATAMQERCLPLESIRISKGGKIEVFKDALMEQRGFRWRAVWEIVE